jgi:hypothetical protein
LQNISRSSSNHFKSKRSPKKLLNIKMFPLTSLTSVAAAGGGAQSSAELGWRAPGRLGAVGRDRNAATPARTSHGLLPRTRCSTARQPIRSPSPPLAAPTHT